MAEGSVYRGTPLPKKRWGKDVWIAAMIVVAVGSFLLGVWAGGN